MSEKMNAVLDVFRAGGTVADPVKWKTRQVTATVLAPVIVAIAHVGNAYGIAIPIDTETATGIAGMLIVVINVVLTHATTDKIGILPAKSDGDNSVGQSEQG